ncbi:hypothetical protein H8E88_26445 [candidate division KSB1 bacterium]|nr:hypothetical protein [candidate division KSB1 bacterium]MBL7094456.1 hypothetical protein [candidate division KSB1 bacterium]
MALPYHRKDFVKVPNEDDVMDALRKFNIPPGEYVIPCAESPAEMKSPEFIEKTNKGPVGFFTVMKSGTQSMGTSLVLWFVYSIVVSIFAAYIASRALESEAHYMAVFRFVGCTAFIGYAVALWQNSTWYKRKWSTTLKNTFDGLVYALVTAGTFGWLWP